MASLISAIGDPIFDIFPIKHQWKYRSSALSRYDLVRCFHWSNSQCNLTPLLDIKCLASINFNFVENGWETSDCELGLDLTDTELCIYYYIASTFILLWPCILYFFTWLKIANNMILYPYICDISSVFGWVFPSSESTWLGNPSPFALILGSRSWAGGEILSGWGFVVHVRHLRRRFWFSKPVRGSPCLQWHDAKGIGAIPRLNRAESSKLPGNDLAS